MYADTEMKYRPQQLDGFVFPNSEVEEVINAYASGKATRPLLLSGKNGTGKSLLASLLPHAIEGFEAQINCVRACDLNSNKEVQAKFASNKNFDRLFTINGQTRNYNVIEEVNFDPRARDAFRVVLDEYRGTDLTILTTNELAKIDVGIRSRCEVLEVPPCEPRLFLKRAKEILVAEGCDIDDGDWGCKKVCVNGHSAGNCHIARSDDDRREKSSIEGIIGWPVGRLPQTRGPDRRERAVKTAHQAAGRTGAGSRDGRAPWPRQERVGGECGRQYA